MRPSISRISLYVISISLCISASLAKTLPIVDLGYVQQQATYYDPEIDAFTFKNIRYAEPPIAELRFRPPLQPTPEMGGIQNGSEYASPACLQAISQFGGLSNTSVISEDCLFLDVVVPSSIQPDASVPVLVWIHGGGFTTGSKDGNYSATGLFKRSAAPVIYVSINYRLGALGWLSAPEPDIVPNAGLYDVRAALDWVQKYIHLFGGDSDAVTAMGESAGAGSILHLITAYGGKKEPPPFQQAIAQSPGYVPVKNNPQGRLATFNAFLNHTGCSDVRCLRQANTSILTNANDYMTTVGASGGVGFGPVVDGDLVPDLPGKLLSEGKYHRTLRGLVSANNAHEGGLYIPDPDSVAPGDFDSFVGVFLPTANQTTLNTLQTLYPPVPETDKLGNWRRVTDFISDVLFTCNAQFLASTSFSPQGPMTYRYVFGVGSAIHGSDVDFTFYSGNNYSNKTSSLGDNSNSTGIISANKAEQVAFDMQTMITNFVLYGRPKVESFGNMQLPRYEGDDRATFVFNGTRLYTVLSDPWKNACCDWWQLGLFAD